MDQPYLRRITSLETAGLIAKSWVFCIVYCAIAFPIFYVFAVKDRILFGALVSGFFAVWGVVYVWITIQKTLEYWKFGELNLRLREAPALGTELEGELRAPGLGLRPVQVDLMALEEVLGTDSKGRTTRSEKLVWRRLHRLSTRGGRIEFRVTVPDEPEIQRGVPYLWRLRIRADLPGLDLDRTFALDVVQGPRKPPAPVPLPQAQSAAPEQSVVGAIETPRIAPAGVVHAEVEVAQAPPSVSAPVLVAANLLPLAGVLFWGWRVGDLVILYWVENLVIGAVHVLRILFANPDQVMRAPRGPQITGGEWMAGKAALAGFFLVHYGGFCAAHGMVLAALFPVTNDSGGKLEIWEILSDMLREPGSLGAIALLVASHGYSFARNYVGREEYRRVDIGRMMFRPYGRVLVVHLFVIAGGLVVQVLQGPAAALLLFVLLKTGIDYAMHRRERALLSPQGA
jgi:hypothetical protein